MNYDRKHQILRETQAVKGVSAKFQNAGECKYSDQSNPKVNAKGSLLQLLNKSSLKNTGVVSTPTLNKFVHVVYDAFRLKKKWN